MPLPGKLRALAGLLLGLVLVTPAFCGDEASDRVDVRPAAPVRLEPSYKIQAGIDGEIYPVFANYASLQRQGDRTFGVVSVTLSNSSQAAIRRQVSVKIPGWSDEEIQTVELPAGAVRTLVFAPAFLPRLYQNHEIVAAAAHINISDGVSSTLYQSTVPVRLRSAEDIFWGHQFKYAPFIASWITPHDSRVESVLAQVDVAYLDGTFHDASELPGRDLREIPHPLMTETLSRLAASPLLSKVRFIHLNQSNPLLRERRDHVVVAKDGERFGL